MPSKSTTIALVAFCLLLYLRCFCYLPLLSMIQQHNQNNEIKATLASYREENKKVIQYQKQIASLRTIVEVNISPIEILSKHLRHGNLVINSITNEGKTIQVSCSGNYARFIEFLKTCPLTIRAVQIGTLPELRYDLIIGEIAG